MRHGELRIGTSGWNYRDWPGIFYPNGLKSTEWLSYYSQSFDTTEINSSFYHLPQQKTVVAWASKVPENFRFCAKMSRYITHTKRLKEPEDALEKFFDVFAHIKPWLGPVLVQLPPSLQFDRETALHFFRLVNTVYGDYEFALEARHPSWLDKEVVALIKKFKISFVIAHSGVGFPYAEVVTSKTVYLRFHGPGLLYFSSYSDEMLATYATKCRKWMAEGRDVWALFNNTGKGVGIENAKNLHRLITEQ